MIINTNLKNFKKQHTKKNNQIIYHSEKFKNKFIIENLIDNFLKEKNSFVFESVEKGKIRGRYTIFGRDPDKIWEFNKNKVFYLKNKKKTKIKTNPYVYLNKLVEEFKFKSPKNLPPLCSLLSGFFSYDIIRYIEKIPNNCKDDLNLPDIRLIRPRSLIIHDNLKKNIHYIVNCYSDEKITNYQKKFSDIKLKINTMGDTDSRRLYISKLQDYLNSKIDQIPESIKPRVSANPLRVLDSKDPKMFEINNAAPKCLDYINAASSEHWTTLLKNLDALSIPYEVDHKLVRGFDYYTRTVFEIVPSVEKTQNTLIGGGRYDGLIEILGGKSTPGIGFAMGLERVASALDHTLSELESNNSIKLLVAHMGDPAKERAVLLSSRIRTAGLPAVLAPTRGIKSQLRYATSISATHAIIVGEEELQNREVVLRTFATHSQETISEANLINFLSSIS